MEKAKKAVSDFVSKDGSHDTTVHETVNPAIQKETIRPTQHEEINTAVNREIHQDHYRQKIQPVRDSEVLPEQHSAKLGKTIQREYDNRDQVGAERAMKAEADKLKDERHVTGTTSTSSHAPTVTGEQVHHHIHETIQPVVHKETIQPSVVHTTQPIHEIHHNEEKIHGTTTLPAMSMNEFQKMSGSLGGGNGGVRSEAFVGCPENISAHASGCPADAHGGRSNTSKSGVLGSSASGTESHEKPSLLDRLNPYKET